MIRSLLGISLSAMLILGNIGTVFAVGDTSEETSYSTQVVEKIDATSENANVAADEAIAADVMDETSGTGAEVEKSETEESEESELIPVEEVSSENKALLSSVDSLAPGTYTEPLELSDDVTVEGDITFTSSLRLNGHTLTVNGNMTAKWVWMENGSLYVSGNVEMSNTLTWAAGGTVEIGGDLTFDSQSDDVTCELAGSSNITIGGSLLLKTATKLDSTVLITLGGDLIQSVATDSDIALKELNLIGSGTQKVSLQKNFRILNLIQTNENPIEWDGWMNATFGSDVNITLSKDALYTNGLTIVGHDFTVPGTLIATGTVWMDKGDLEVTGDYVQMDNYLYQTESTSVEIGGDLRFQGMDENGNYTAGTGYASTADDAVLTVDGNLWVQSAYSVQIDAALSVRGNITQLDDNPSLELGKLILTGSEKQTVTLTKNSKINGLSQTNPEAAIEWVGYLNAALDADINITAPEGTLYTTKLTLNDHGLAVQGSMVASGTISAGAGTLNVADDYVQTTGTLECGTGTVEIGGNLRFQGIDADGEYTTGMGMVGGSTEAQLTVDESVFIDSSYPLQFTSGTISVGGDIICLNEDDPQVNLGTLKLVGSEKQTVNIPENSTIKRLMQTNENAIEWNGYLNIEEGLDSDVSVIVSEEPSILYTTGLKMDAYKLQVNGSLVATGDVDFGNATLEVTGDYVQSKGGLSYAAAVIWIGGDLRIQRFSISEDATISYAGGSSFVATVEGNENAVLTVEGNLYVQSNKGFTISGTLNVKGNVEQSTGAVTITNLILAGSGTQYVDFSNTKSKIGTLVLTKDYDNYSFNPEPCWVYLATRTITLDMSTATINKGETVILTATKNPALSTDTLSWTSSDKSVATVSDAGEVTGKGAGTATITVKTTKGLSATCIVTVEDKEVPATKVALNKTTATLAKGKTVTLSKTLTPGDSTDTVKWSSSNTKVATVSSSGVVTAKGAGTATITATTTSGKKATCKVTVTIPSTKITMSKTTATVKKGKTLTLKGTLAPSNSTDTVKWSSSNTSVATVTSKGVVTGKKAGTATITVTTSSGKKATCKVTVK
jgi:uncharacterized protein YjdB